MSLFNHFEKGTSTVVSLDTHPFVSFWKFNSKRNYIHFIPSANIIIFEIKGFSIYIYFLNLAFIWITSWDSVTILMCYWMRVSHWSKSNSLNLKWSPILNLFDTKILPRFICKKRKVVVWGLCCLLVPILSYPLDKWQQRRRKSPGGDKPDKVHENYD